MKWNLCWLGKNRQNFSLTHKSRRNQKFNSKQIITLGFSIGILLQFINPQFSYATQRDAQPQIKIGQGFSTSLDQVKGLCLSNPQFETQEAKTVGGGQTHELRYKIISESGQLSDFFNISTQAQLKVKGGHLSGQVSAKANVVVQKSMNRNSVFLAISSVVKNQVSRIQEPLTVDPYWVERNTNAETKSFNYDSFRRDCGDSFLASRLTGGEFYGLVEFSSESSTLKKMIEGELDIAF